MKTTSFFIFIMITTFMFTTGCSSDSDSNNKQTTPPAADTNKSMHFIVHVPTVTPEDEIVCIGFDSAELPHPMKKISATRWELTLDIDTPIDYRYCRNCECGAADEQFDMTEKRWRQLTVIAGGTQEDTVNKWRWWNSYYFNKANEVNLSAAGYTHNKPSLLPRSDFMSGVMFNDYWNPEWKEDINSTITHIRAETNATWIEYAPVNDITQFYPSPKIDFNGFNGTSQVQLEAIIDAAHAQGLKVFINPIPWASSATDNTPGDHNATWWQAYYNAWKPIMMRYAQIAEKKGVEMLAFKMWPNIDALTSSEQNNMDDLSLSLLKSIDGNYSGKIGVQSICYDTSSPDLKVYGASETDYLLMSIWSYYPWPLSKDPNNDTDPGDKDANVTTMKRYFATHLDTGSYGSIEDFSTAHNKPIIFAQLSAPAYDGAIVEPAAEDELLNPFFINDDSKYHIDLQEQADVIETVLCESMQRSFIQGSFTFTYYYWNSIDKDINVRGKPAEKVVKKWYQWIQK